MFRFYFTQCAKLCPEEEKPFSNLHEGTRWLLAEETKGQAGCGSPSRELRLVEGSERGSRRKEEEAHPTEQHHHLSTGSS